MIKTEKDVIVALRRADIEGNPYEAEWWRRRALADEKSWGDLQRLWWFVRPVLSRHRVARTSRLVATLDVLRAGVDYSDVYDTLEAP